jgi:hypothetical protein
MMASSCKRQRERSEYFDSERKRGQALCLKAKQTLAKCDRKLVKPTRLRVLCVSLRLSEHFPPVIENVIKDFLAFSGVVCPRETQEMDKVWEDGLCYPWGLDFSLNSPFVSSTFAPNDTMVVPCETRKDEIPRCDQEYHNCVCAYKERKAESASEVPFAFDVLFLQSPNARFRFLRHAVCLPLE